MQDRHYAAHIVFSKKIILLWWRHGHQPTSDVSQMLRFVLLYGSCTPSEDNHNETPRGLCSVDIQKILRISWIDKVSMSEILRREHTQLKSEKSLVTLARVIKWSRLGGGILSTTVNSERKNRGSSGVGRKQLYLLRNLREHPKREGAVSLGRRRGSHANVRHSVHGTRKNW